MLKPLIVWAGGKTKMLKHYKPYLESLPAGLRYCEPFLGGGAVFCWLYNAGKLNSASLNDANAELMLVYEAVQQDFQQFAEKLQTIEKAYLPLDNAERKQMFYDFRKANANAVLQEPAILYFLFRTCFNGIYQVNKNTNGRFGTPAGLLSQNNLFDYGLLEQWHQALQIVELTCLDWRALQYDYYDFVYLDPPYRGCYTSYGQLFTDSDQLALLSLLASKAKVMLSNRDIGDGFYDSYKPVLLPVTYTAGRRKRTESGFEAKQAIEVLITNMHEVNNPNITTLH